MPDANTNGKAGLYVTSITLQANTPGLTYEADDVGLSFVLVPDDGSDPVGGYVLKWGDSLPSGEIVAMDCEVTVDGKTYRRPSEL